jgi:2-oxo-4-hydroxy-4-carboxy-5-ureidoimidazoline decarboxylase
MTITQLNELTRDQFVCVVGPVFEHSPWIAEETCARRPFATVEELHRALCKTVEGADEARQVKLIQAHPDLVGRAALAGTLTQESKCEQASAGLTALSAEEIALFQKNNSTYREKFGFPFVICARLNRKEAILKGFEVRLRNTREQEIRAALEEIEKIAWLRLSDLVTG